MKSIYDIRDATIRYGMAEYKVDVGCVTIDGSKMEIEYSYEFALKHADLLLSVELVTEQLAVRIMGDIHLDIEDCAVAIVIENYEAIDL